MKAPKLFIYSVVLWTLVEYGSARRLSRSLGVEGSGGNLTQKQHQEVVQSEALQHFTTTPTSSEPTTKRETRETTSAFIRDVPAIPEDINVQSLKNDNQLHLKDETRLSDIKELNGAFQINRTKTLKDPKNEFFSHKLNQTRAFDQKKSDAEKAHSYYEHLVISNDNAGKEEKQEAPQVLTSTDSVKLDPEWKSFEVKKKEKGKKEIYESVTVPNDNNGAGRIEKPLKDNAINMKLKDKNKDTNSEASDDKRSTTISIGDSGSSSSSFSLSQKDNKKSLSSVSFPLIDSTGTKEDAVNQSVFSVINNNNVNSELMYKTKKYSIKRTPDVVNDTEGDNSSSNGNLLNEDAPNDSVAGVNLESQVSQSTFQTSTTGIEKPGAVEQKISLQRLKPTESSPTKVDMFEKALPSTITIIKPSLAFKQQLANKLKGLDPAPTMPIININGEELDENQEKSSSSKSSTKPSLRKKPKVDYHSPASDIFIPPTATAWTLASMKLTPDSLLNTTPQKPTSLIGETSPPTSDPLATSTLRQNPSSVPGSQVKSFVPWSTRLLKTTTSRSPPTAESQSVNGQSSPSTHSQKQLPTSSLSPHHKFEEGEGPQQLPSSPSTAEQSVIRTTMELENNVTETLANTIPSSLNDMMVKDQSTSRSQSTPTTESVIRNTVTKEQQTLLNLSRVIISEKSTEKENIIGSKLSEEINDDDKTEAKPQEKLKKDSLTESKNNTANEVLFSDLSQTVNEVKPVNTDIILNATKSTSTTPSETGESVKVKAMSEIGEVDPISSDILIDGGGEDGKYPEESEEEEKTKKTTTHPPYFDPLETTMVLDMDEDEIENEREEYELSVANDNNKILKKETLNKSPLPSKSTENMVDIKPTTSTPSVLKENTTGAYVTSFDINLKDNISQTVTRGPSIGDKNWYNVETKSNSSGLDEETNIKTIDIDVTTTAVVETTVEPETATESSKQETTLLPETTKTVMTSSVPASTLSSVPPTVTDSTDTVVQEDNDPDDEEDNTNLSCEKIPVVCQDPQQLKEYIASQLMNENISWEQIRVMGQDLEDCKDVDDNEDLFGGRLEVKVCFFDKDEKPSPAIRKEFKRFYSKRIIDPKFPAVEINTKQPADMEDGFDNVFAAIILSVIAAVCLVLLGILLVIVRKRQGRFNYGQRCTPVSLDDYSLDNISVHNSVRRKGALRASKRSYGNPAFDDPGGPSHSVNFAGLANFSNDRQALDEEFSQIPMITVKPDELPPGAESKNRYANVIPLPETRVLLQPKEGKEAANPLDEYINANHIKGPKSQEKLYIACQAPLQSTVEDFWKMVWQQQTKVILMLTSLHENGVEKCADYLPQLEVTDCHRLFGDFQVTLKKHEVREKYIISSLQLKNLESNLWREVTHLWYSSWPAQGVPDDGSAMIAFLIEARSYMRGAQGPTVVHCSPGTGRTGTVIAIDLCIRDFETQRNVDIPKTVYALRRDRAGAVQTKDQYAFIYQVLNLYATKLTGGALDSI